MPLILDLTLLSLVITAGAIDLKTRRIPNRLVLVGLCLGIAMNSFLFEWGGLRQSLAGAGVAFAIYFVFYLLRAMGAGDVKLMTAIGALSGPRVWMMIFFFTAIAGGVIALVLLVAKGRLKKTLFNVSVMLHQLMHLQAPYHATEELDVRSGKGLRLPHGASIAIGTVVYLVFIAFQR